MRTAHCPSRARDGHRTAETPPASRGAKRLEPIPDRGAPKLISTELRNRSEAQNNAQPILVRDTPVVGIGAIIISRSTTTTTDIIRTAPQRSTDAGIAMMSPLVVMVSPASGVSASRLEQPANRSGPAEFFRWCKAACL
jgi:hypothetical protein